MWSRRWRWPTAPPPARLAFATGSMRSAWRASACASRARAASRGARLRVRADAARRHVAIEEGERVLPALAGAFAHDEGVERVDLARVVAVFHRRPERT